MKYLFYSSFFLMSSAFGAISLVKHKSSPDGSSTMAFAVEENKISLEKNSNLFDRQMKDYRIGKFATKGIIKKEDLEKLTVLEQKLKIVDETLRKRKSSFNQVSGDPGHSSVIMLGTYRIPESSKYYAEVDGIIRELQELPWTLEKGWELSPDLSLVKVYEEGKIKKTDKYIKQGYCKDSLPMCTYASGGWVYIRR